MERTTPQELIWRKHSLKYQQDCIAGFMTQPITEIMAGMSVQDFMIFMNQVNSPDDSWSRVILFPTAEKYMTENNIDFPGKKEYLYFILSERIG